MIVAVTGRSGSGKSRVAAVFEARGANRIDADRIGRAVWEEDPEVQRRIIDALGPGVATPDGTVDRDRLGRAVFGDPERLDRFDRIVQPLLKERIAAEIDRAAADRRNVWILDAALLYDWGFESRVDRIVEVTARTELRVRRIADRHGLPLAEARTRAASQGDREEGTRPPDWRIENDGTLKELERKASALWEKIREEEGREE